MLKISRKIQVHVVAKFKNVHSLLLQIYLITVLWSFGDAANQKVLSKSLSHNYAMMRHPNWQYRSRNEGIFYVRRTKIPKTNTVQISGRDTRRLIGIDSASDPPALSWNPNWSGECPWFGHVCKLFPFSLIGNAIACRGCVLNRLSATYGNFLLEDSTYSPS